MKSLSVGNILLFHKKIICETGGIEGVRDLGLIESAINRAFSTFDGQDLYKSKEEKISVVTYGLIKNHGFVDGNKRIGVAMMLLLLVLNKMIINYTQEELIDLGLGVAEGILDEKGIFKWIIKHRE